MQDSLQSILDNKINLSQSKISQGSISHNYIRDLLSNKSRNDTDFPWILDGDFLSGSYARGTKLSPLNDIDVMIVLDGTGLVPRGLESTHFVRASKENSYTPVHKHLNQENLLKED